MSVVASMVGLVASFPRKRGGLFYLLLSASMLTVCLGELSVAPDDFASECTIHAEPGTFSNPNQKVLLDTQFYPSTTLLTILGEDGLWISLDFDMTTGAGIGKVRKHENHREANRESVSMCIISLCIRWFACSGLIRARV